MPMKFVPCRARTPSSASNSCCRIRRWSARPVRSSGISLSGFGSTTGSPWSDDVFITHEIAYLHSHSELIGAQSEGERPRQLGSVGIQDSHADLVVIQALDGPIRFD